MTFVVVLGGIGHRNKRKKDKKCDGVSHEAVGSCAARGAQACPEAGARAAVGARRVAAARGVGAGAALALLLGAAGAVDVAGAAAPGGGGDGLGADVGAGELLVQGQGDALGGCVGVAGTPAARVEAAGAAGAGLGRGRDTRGCGGEGGTEHVARAAPAGVGVAVLGHGGVRLGDGVPRHGWVRVRDYGILGVSSR